MRPSRLARPLLMQLDVDFDTGTEGDTAGVFRFQSLWPFKLNGPALGPGKQ
jgi:hypothetical protein